MSYEGFPCMFPWAQAQHGCAQRPSRLSPYGLQRSG